MGQIMRVARKHKIKVIEDAAEAHGAEYKGRKCGSMGDINCFSFYGNKIITSGEGGMVVTNNDDLANRAKKIKDLFHSDKKRFIHENIGYNYRLTNIQAAIGCGELMHIDEYIKKKHLMAELYFRSLRKIPGIITPVTKKWAKNVYWMYAIQIDKKKFGMDKDTLRQKLKEIGIDTRDFFYPPTDQPVLRKYITKGDGYPVAKLIADQGLYLPSGLAITREQIKRVIKGISDLHRLAIKNQ